MSGLRIKKESVLLRSKIQAFTLVELIIVVIIVGILASLGLTQYSNIVEKARLAEVKMRIGTMRQLAHEYYWEHGTFEGITNADIGVDNTCSSDSYYKYWQTGGSSTYIALVGTRCSTTGKPPAASRIYQVVFRMYVNGSQTWHCYYTDDNSPCFGYPN